MAVKEGGSFQTFRDPNGNVLSSINRDGSFLTQEIDFADGTVQSTAAGGGGGLTLQTQGVPNGSQTLLNLTSSTLSLVDDGVGNVSLDYNLPTLFNPTLRSQNTGETTSAAVTLSFSAPATGGASIIRVSCYRVILAAASTSFTMGTIVTNYTVPVLGAVLNFTIPAASVDGSSALGANTPGAAYSKTFDIAISSGTNATTTWNGTLSDGGGTFDSFFYMTAEVISSS